MLSLDAETQYALWRQRRRVHLQRAEGLALALRAATTLAKLPAAWFDALADSEDEAAASQYRVNADRSEAALLRNHR